MAKPFPIWLQDQLDERDWKQADLVRATGGRLRAQTLSKWMAGKGLPPELPSIELLSEAFTLSIEDIVRAVREEDVRRTDQHPDVWLRAAPGATAEEIEAVLPIVEATIRAAIEQQRKQKP